MLLVVDAGNTTIKFAVYDKEVQSMGAFIATDRNKGMYEYAVDFTGIFRLYHIDCNAITDAVISSVVPEITHAVKGAIGLDCKVEALILDSGFDTGLHIGIEYPLQLGPDLVAGGAAAVHKYGSPCAVYDLGTATTVSVIDEGNIFLGGLIYPGVKISLNALSMYTSQLPHIAIEAPATVIGANTVHSMQSGITYGTAAMIDGIAARLEGELNKKIRHIATGGFAKTITPYCHNDIIYDENLIFDGLRLIYNRNRKYS